MTINSIGFGKENKKTREQLMKENQITTTKDFNEQLAQLKRKYIILENEEGYYRPNSKAEYQLVIQRLLKRKQTIDSKIKLVYEEIKNGGYN